MGNKISKLISELVSINRRIDNMRYLVVFKERDRNVILEQMREELGRSAPRTQFIDYDARRDPKTDRYCIMCQKDIGAKSPAFHVRLVNTKTGGPHAMHIDDIAMFDLEVLVLPEGDEDLGSVLIGTDCAKKLGLEWCKP